MARLNDVCINITDGSHNPPPGIDFSQHIMLSSKNIDDDYISIDNPRYLSEEDYQNENRRTDIKKGDLLITIVGTVGRVAIVPVDLEGICVQRSVAVLKINQRIVHNRYLMYQLQNMRPFLEREARGVAQKGIYLKQLSSLSINVPQMDEQRRIAAVLDKVSGLIAKRREQLRKLDELVKARFVEMFGDCKTNPKDWKTCRLDEIAEVGSSKRVFVDELKKEGIPFFRGTEIGALAEGKTVRPELFIAPQHYKALCDMTGTPQKGDLLMPSICPDGRIWLVNTDNPFYFKDGRVLWVHHISKQFDPVFLLYTLKDRIMTDYSSIASGTTFAELKIFALKKCLVFKAPLRLQSSFAIFIQKTEQLKLTIQQSLDKLEVLKKALMQQYFGRTSL